MSEPGTFIEVSSFTVSEPEYVTWTPQEDITTYELARCIGLIGNGWLTKAHIPSGCERHFTVWRQEK